MKLTKLEQKALTALQASSRANGHDFGLLETVKWDGDRKRLGALVTSLRKKGVITSIDEAETDEARYTQYVLAEKFCK